MRFYGWYIREKGATRNQTWFAFLPVRIKDETRWLEKVTVEWMVVEAYGFLPPCLPYLKWKKNRFINK